MITELTTEAFENTLVSRMIDVSSIAEPEIDIWPYVAQLCTAQILPEVVFNEHLVEKVYRTLDYTIEHVLLPTNNSNQIVVVVINRNIPEISGHYRLHAAEEFYK